MSDRPSSVPPNQAQASVPSGSHCRKAAWLWTTGEERKASARPGPAFSIRPVIRAAISSGVMCASSHVRWLGSEMNNSTHVVKLKICGH